MTTLEVGSLELFWSLVVGVWCFRLLLLVFPFADSFQHREPGFFGIGDRQGLEMDRRTEIGQDPAHWFSTGGTLCQFWRTDRATQRKAAFAGSTTSFAQFIFVKGHNRRTHLTKDYGVLKYGMLCVVKAGKPIQLQYRRRRFRLNYIFPL
ncbi:MAG: hypothetical protein JWM68_3344 [Verrucomicrobiales bacterium]|nr:hypothetical protein [Verrucomicrobiales bacterium]